MSFGKVKSTTLQVKPLELLVKKKSNEKQIGIEAGLDGVVGVNFQVNCCQIFPLSSKIYRVFFFTGPPLKKLKLGRSRLGEVRCI